jgi:hypothetical protein
MATKLQSKKKSTSRTRRKVAKKGTKKTDQAWREEDQDNLDTLEFIKAIDRYRRRSQKAFPTWSEVLEILKSLGYRKSKS